MRRAPKHANALRRLAAKQLIRGGLQHYRVIARDYITTSATSVQCWGPRTFTTTLTSGTLKARRRQAKEGCSVCGEIETNLE